MKKILLAWIGAADLKASTGREDSGLGPILQAAQQLTFDHIHLLSNYPQRDSQAFIEWLVSSGNFSVSLDLFTLESPVHFGDIYKSADIASISIIKKIKDSQLCFHLSPGTPAMSAVWILLGKTKYNALFVQSSQMHGSAFINIPFDISAEFIPDLLLNKDKKLSNLATTKPNPDSGFEQIIFRSKQMARVVAQAHKVALRSVPVLIEGESGTGKELFARAIHKSSARMGKPFIAVNCGAIPHELIESELFGHTKGAFTGAAAARKGYFQEADSGTIFLDEIGELPAAAQVKLLRVLQEGQVTPLGADHPSKINVRVIAATNRNLLEESAAGRFRPDLFYRLAVAILKLPTLREREGDLGLLISALLEQVNKESREEPGYRDKKISVSARNILLRHTWPGNVRELLNTLRRMAIWSDGTTITEADAQDAILQLPKEKDEGILGLTLGEGVVLPEIMSKVASHYLARAIKETAGNKTKAAALLGLPNYQTLTNWLQKYGIE